MTDSFDWMDREVAAGGRALLASCRAERAPSRVRDSALLAAQGALLGGTLGHATIGHAATGQIAGGQVAGGQIAGVAVGASSVGAAAGALGGAVASSSAALAVSSVGAASVGSGAALATTGAVVTTASAGMLSGSAGMFVSGAATSGVAASAGVVSAGATGGSLLIGAFGLAKVAAVAALLAGGVYLGAQSNGAVATSEQTGALAGVAPDVHGAHDGARRGGGSALLSGTEGASVQASSSDARRGPEATLVPKPDLPSAPHSVAGQFAGSDHLPVFDGARADTHTSGTVAARGVQRRSSGVASDDGRYDAADSVEAAGAAESRAASAHKRSGARRGRGAERLGTTDSASDQSGRALAAHADGAPRVNEGPRFDEESESGRGTSTELTGRLGQELQLIQRARRQLRAHDLQGALTTLRLHIELYPDGELMPEANRLRLQAQREMAAD